MIPIHRAFFVCAGSTYGFNATFRVAISLSGFAGMRGTVSCTPLSALIQSCESAQARSTQLKTNSGTLDLRESSGYRCIRKTLWRVLSLRMTKTLEFVAETV